MESHANGAAGSSGNDVITLVADRILALSRPCVVGINGVDASGKTTFARTLARHIRASGHIVSLVHLDDFHNPRTIRATGRNEIDAYIRHAFDLGRVVADLLEPVKRGETVDRELSLLDLDTDTFTRKRRYVIGRNTIVLLEGVLLYREPLDGYFDLRIFLDVSFDEVLRRAAVRDVPARGPEFLGRYRTRYIPVQQWYLSAHRPAERSDIVIDNNDCLRPRIIKK